MGCTSGNCREVQAEKDKNTNSTKTITNKNTPGAQDRVKVFKYDGSLQCGMGKSISVDEMKTQLKGISIYSSNNKPDGLMHMQACGTSTGKANVYEIDRKNLPEAIQFGFKEWLWE